MCSKGSGSPPVPNQTSTAFQSATTPSQFMLPIYQNFVNQAQNLATTPFNPAMQGSVAPMNTEQTQAGAQMFEQGMHLGEFDPNAVKAIESPYTEDVVQATQDWFNNQNVIQGNDLMSQAIRSGNAFGGDRAGIAEARLAGQQQLAQAPVIAGLRQTGYTQALDEYNRLKQFGMAGTQAALGWGQQEQQQAQRELDVAQQNAMMASAYPFQQMNWLGSILGGIGPLTGSFTQGYTTPPPPDATTTGLGIATSLAGLGTSLFNSFDRGGMVRSPSIVPGLAEGGSPDDYYGSESTDTLRDSSDDRDRMREAPPPPDYSNRWAGSLSKGAVPFQVAKGPQVAQMPSQGGQQKDPQKSEASQIIDLAGKFVPLAAKAFTLLAKRGGNVGRYQYGGSESEDELIGGSGDDLITTRGSWYGQAPEAGWIDRGDRPNSNKLGVPESEQGIATRGNKGLGDYYNVWMPGKRPGVDMPELARKTDVGPADWTGRGIDISAAAAQKAGYRPGNFPTDKPISYAPVTAMGSPPGLPEDQYGLPGGKPLRDDPGGGVDTLERPTAGLGGPSSGGGQGNVREIPGLKAKPETFMDRFSKNLATNPLLQFGAGVLSKRSPYGSANIGAGLESMIKGQQAQAKQGVLDDKPQMITDAGTIQWRVGNKLIDTGIKTTAAINAEETRKLREQYLDAQRQTREAAASKPQTIQTINGPVSAVKDKDGNWKQVDVQEQTAAAAPAPQPAPAQTGPGSAPAATSGVGSVPNPAVKQDDTEPSSQASAISERSGSFMPQEAPAALVKEGQRAAEAAGATAAPQQPAAAPQQPVAQVGQATAVPEPKTDDQKETAALAAADTNKFKTPLTPKVLQMLEQRGMTPEQFDFTAMRLAMGDNEVQKVGAGKGAGALKSALQARASQYYIDQGMDAHQARAAQAEFAAMKAGARSLGTQEARITGAITVAQKVAPAVLDASANVDRTNYPDLNKVIMAYNQKTGDQNVVRLATSVHAMINNYAAAMGKGNSVMTDNSQRRAGELLNTAFSHNQMKAAIDQMMVEMDRELQGTKAGMPTFLKKDAPEYKPGDVFKGQGGNQGAAPAGPQEGQKKTFKEGPATFKGGKWVLD